MISFDSILIGANTIVRNDNAYKRFTLKVIEDSSIRSIPPQFKNDFAVDVFGATASDDAFNRIHIPLTAENITYHVNFSGIKFDAKIDAMSANVKQKKDGTFCTTYTFTFVKELEANIDTSLETMMLVREEDENGKKKLVQYATELEKV